MGLDLQKTENRHYFRDRHFWNWSKEIKQAWNILLKIQLDLQGLEKWSWLLPDVLETLIGNLFKLIDFLKEIIHVTHALLKHSVLWASYNIKFPMLDRDNNSRITYFMATCQKLFHLSY